MVGIGPMILIIALIICIVMAIEINIKDDEKHTASSQYLAESKKIDSELLDLDPGNEPVFEAPAIQGVFKCQACGASNKINSNLRHDMRCAYCNAGINKALARYDQELQKAKANYQRELKEFKKRQNQFRILKLEKIKNDQIQSVKIRQEEIQRQKEEREHARKMKELELQQKREAARRRGLLFAVVAFVFIMVITLVFIALMRRH